MLGRHACIPVTPTRHAHSPVTPTSVTPSHQSRPSTNHAHFSVTPTHHSRPPTSHVHLPVTPTYQSRLPTSDAHLPVTPRDKSPSSIVTMGTVTLAGTGRLRAVHTVYTTMMDGGMYHWLLQPPNQHQQQVTAVSTRCPHPHMLRAT